MIVLFGLAGTGKGTQAKALSEFFGWRTFSVGQVIRDTGKYNDTTNAGGLIPDDDVIALMTEQIERASAEGFNVILDGYPRTEYQAKWLMEHMRDDIEGAIILEVPKEELYERLELRGREDDKSKEAIDRRWEIFEQNISPILTLLEQNHIPVKKVDGVGAVEAVTERLISTVKELSPNATAQQMTSTEKKSKKVTENKMLNVTNASPKELEEKITAMREGGKILGTLLRDLKNYVKPGMTGKEVDSWVRKEIVKRGAKVAYDMLDDDFPGAICISVNDELVHGAPKNIEFEEGDKVSFDLDIYYKGYFTDSAFTMLVGNKGSAAVKNMIKVTESSMYEGIEQVKPGAHIGDISEAVEKVLRKGHLGVIENYVGHGIDKEMHERPEVPNYGKKGHGYKLEEGDTICIEPMSCLGKPANYVDKDDNWTAKMKDGSIACHCEHTVLVTKDGYEILTLPE